MRRSLGIKEPGPADLEITRMRRRHLRGVMAIDRQAMADVIQAGLVPVAHSYVRPDEPEYAPTESYLVRYDYDPRRAVEGIESVGFVRGPDGGFRDAANQRLTLEIRTTGGDDLQEKTMFSTKTTEGSAL